MTETVYWRKNQMFRLSVILMHNDQISGKFTQMQNQI